MKRFVYGPDVGALIATQEFGVIDVSDDIVSGSITRRLDAASSANLTLQNRFKKYNRKIKPMDRIVIYLQRVHEPMLAFAGYVDSGPFDQLFPDTVDVTATCTLKRLNNTYWDPGLPYVQKFLAQYAGWEYVSATGQFYDPFLNLNNMDFNGGLGHLLRILMNKVGNWPIGLENENKNTVHVLKLPKSFLSKTESVLADQIKAEGDDRKEIIGLISQFLTVDGAFTAPYGTQPSDYNPTDPTTDANPVSKNLAGTYKGTIFGSALNITKSPTADELIQLYHTAGATYNIPWQILAAINKVETGFGTNMNVSSAGALGWMQFIPDTWKRWGTDADGDGTANLYSPADAIYSAARYLAASSTTDMDKAIFSYNHANWYVQEVKDLALKYGWSGHAGSNSDTTAGTAALKADIKDRGTGAPRNPDGSPISSNTKSPSSDGIPGDVYVPLSFWNAAKKQQVTFRIKGNPYGNDKFIFKAMGYKIPGTDRGVPDGQIAIYVPGGTPQALAWKNKDVVVETSAGGTPFSATGAQASTDATAPKIKMDEATLIGPGGNAGEFNGLQPITKAGLGFIQANFGPFVMTAGYAPTGHKANGEHPKGLAVDLVPVDADGTQWSAAGIKRCDALATWAGWTAVNTGNGDIQTNPVIRFVGWRGYSGHGPPSEVGLSKAHIHLSFRPVSPNLIPDSGGTLGGMPATSSQGTVLGDTGVLSTQTTFAQAAFSVAFGGLALTLPTVEDAIESQYLTGYRALQNDVPLMDWVKFLTQASGRRFMSTPTGDFLAFYPDYFNWSGEAPYFLISPLETIDLKIDISDEQLATHVFGVGDTITDSQINFADRMNSAVASVETVKTFKDFVNAAPDFDPQAFLRRYGARPHVVTNVDIKNSLLLFMFTWMEFLKQWSLQITAQNARFTFLPELIPGGLVEFTAKDLVMFVEEVTHNFDRTGGFTTDAVLTSPSTASGTRNYALSLLDGGYQQLSPGQAIIETK